jgi:hypothetical protein
MQKFSLLFLLFITTNIFAQTNPSAYNLSSGNYTLESWSATAPAGTYPPNMIFQMTADPTGASYNNLSAVATDYSCAYNLASRNRVNGQNANGVSFIATGSGLWDNCLSGTVSAARFAGTAILGLNSTGITGISVIWTGRTLSVGDGSIPRVFSIQLQYRLGISGNFTNVTGALYTSGGAGSNAVVTSTLPAACENRPDLFLRWIYYQSNTATAGISGTRPEIALDDITVGTPPPVNNLSLDYSTSTTSTLLPPFISGTINDANDPAKVTGFIVDVKDNGIAIPAANYTLTVGSSNSTVVPAANVSIVSSDGSALIKITPAAVGLADLTFTLTKGSVTKTLAASYAASQSSSVNAKWPTGIADASAAIALDDNYMMVANDETNLLYVYDRNASGLPVKTYDFNQGNVLSLTDGSPSYKEVDIEAGVRSVASAGRIYWLGSMSNSSSFNDKPNRNRLFATTVTGTGSSSTFANAGSVNNLRQQLISWGDANGYAFSTSAAAGMDPKLIDGFNIEGMVFAPDNTTMYIGFRAPLVPAAGRTKAVIAPIQNFETWFNNGSPAGNAIFGNPIELNLGNRGIRDMIRLSTGTYIIVAGNYDNTPVTGMLYKWSGVAGEAPVALPSFNVTNLNAEGIMEIFEGGTSSLTKLQLIADDGATDFYNTGTEAKDLTHDTYKKFSSEVVPGLITGVVPVQFTYVNATVQGSNAVINWGIEQPADVRSYEVQYATAGNSFSFFAAKPGALFGTDYTYSFSYNKNLSGYYRVKAILYSGNIIYSDVKRLGTTDPDLAFNVYPNPVTAGSFTVTVNDAGKKQAALYNTAGKLVRRIDFTELRKTVDASGLEKGYYMLKVIVGDKLMSTGIIL